MRSSQSPLLSQFFNELSINLNVECTEQASPDVKQNQVHITFAWVQWSKRKDRMYYVGARRYEYSNEPEDVPCDDPKSLFRDLFPEELASVAYHAPKITFVSNKFPAETFHAPNGRNFTIAELLEVLRKWEELDRSRIDPAWGELDRDHVYFEGFEQKGHGIYSICWGS